MAKLKMFAVWDNAVGAYMQPYAVETRGLALRSFMDAAGGSGDSPIQKHPEDFSLFELGTYDQETGRFENLTAPLNLGSASSLVSRHNAIGAEVTDELRARVVNAVEKHSARVTQ